MSYALQPPFLIPEAAAAVSRARRIRHPVWLVGGPGAGAYQVARALHGDLPGFVSVRQLPANPTTIEERIRALAADEPALDSVSLYVERIDRQPASLQERVLGWGDEGARCGGRTIPIRVLGQSDDPRRAAELLPALRHRLGALTVPLPPLDERRADVPALALALAERLSEDLGLPRPDIDDAALRKLAEREWPGNLDELGSVVTRSLIAAEGARIVDFDVPRSTTASSAAARAGTAESARALVLPAALRVPSGGREVRELELVIAELAHELKNPMVTIRTFAENVEQLLNDPALREKFVGLTREAIDRMDSFLEELLRFSRYTEPRLQTVSLTKALTQALGAGDARLRERVKMNGLSGKHSVRVDEEQVGFALKALLRGLAREIPHDASIRVELSPQGELVFHSSAAGGVQQKLAGTLDHESNGNAPWSLDLMMAEALIRRNGGSSRIQRDHDQLQVRVTLPSPERG